MQSNWILNLDKIPMKIYWINKVIVNKAIQNLKKNVFCFQRFKILYFLSKKNCLKLIWCMILKPQIRTVKNYRNISGEEGASKDFIRLQGGQGNIERLYLITVGPTIACVKKQINPHISQHVLDYQKCQNLMEKSIFLFFYFFLFF